MEFKFPFEPYPVQKDFMRALYQTLENKGVGIFESPTGTGRMCLSCNISAVLVYKTMPHSPMSCVCIQLSG